MMDFRQKQVVEFLSAQGFDKVYLKKNKNEKDSNVSQYQQFLTELQKHKL